MTKISRFSLPRQIVIPALVSVLALAACTEGEFGQQPSRPTTKAQQLGELRVGLRKNPTDVTALKKIGDIEAGSGRWNEAMGAYREALVVSPSDRDAILGYGESQLALGDYAGALTMAQRAGGTDIRAKLLQAGALAGLNRLAEARAVLDQASQMNPRDLDVRSNIALVAALSRDPQAYAIGRAVAFAPDSTHAHKRNLVLVGGIMGQEAVARQDGLQLGLGSDAVNQILAVGRRAKTQGMRAFAVLANT